MMAEHHAPDSARAEMVDRQLRARDITDRRVLDAMGAVKRHVFVPPERRADAYRDGPLPIGNGQTISQPYIVARMLQDAKLAPGDRVLDVGTGSGYMAAVIAWITGGVATVERHAELLQGALAALAEAGFAEHLSSGAIRADCRDGRLGWPEHAPYDAIIVSAACPEPPRPLMSQLAPGGRMIAPIGLIEGPQALMRWHRPEGGGSPGRPEWLGDVAFVPLVAGIAHGDDPDALV